MRQALEKLNEFYETLMTLDNPECGFIASYTNYILRDSRRGNHRNLKISINLLTLHHESGTNTYADFLLFLLNKCYVEDNYNFISEICSHCYGNLPQDDRIKNLLLKGIKDSGKSNRLRERFFWNYNNAFKEASLFFFTTDLNEFISTNQDNPEIVIEIINFMFWNIKSDNQHLEHIKKVVNDYIVNKPEVKKKLNSATRELLEIE